MDRKPPKKTAKPSGRNGNVLPVGAHPGNTGGKSGRSGRKPDEFKAICRALATRTETIAVVAAILTDGSHPRFMAALKWASENGYGRPIQRLDVASRGVTLEELVAASRGRQKADRPLSVPPPRKRLPVTQEHLRGQEE